MLKTYGSNNLYFFFFFESRNKCFRIWCYSFTCCIANIIVSALWMRHQASNWRPKRAPGRVREPAGMSLLPAGPAPGERRSRLQTHESFSLLATHEQLMSRALGTGQTHEENKHPLPLATPCLQSTRQRWELQGDPSTITQQPQTSLGFWSTTSFTGSPSHDTRLLFFLVHSFL